MNRRRPIPLPFATYVATHRDTHLRILIAKARLASSIAKAARGNNRGRAYALKYAHVSSIVAIAPELISVFDWNVGTNVVGVRLPFNTGLHVVIRRLTSNARQIIGSRVLMLLGADV